MFRPSSLFSVPRPTFQHGAWSSLGNLVSLATDTGTRRDGDKPARRSEVKVGRRKRLRDEETERRRDQEIKSMGHGAWGMEFIGKFRLFSNRQGEVGTSLPAAAK
jgi:hypothetical protein